MQHLEKGRLLAAALLSCFFGLVLGSAHISSRSNLLAQKRVQMIFSFVEGSPIRHSVLEKISQQTNNKLKTLKSLSTTR